MAQRREVPEQWLAVMQPRGLDSARDLATKAGVAPSTITRLIFGDGDAGEDTVAAVAVALGLSVTRVRRLAGLPAGEDRPFVLPPEANRLDRRQRAAVVEIVRLLLEGSQAATVTSLSAATDRPSPETRGLKVAAKRKREPGDDGR
jgi:transcriptional regulator with XRE-family HTH domain